MKKLLLAPIFFLFVRVVPSVALAQNVVSDPLEARQTKGLVLSDSAPIAPGDVISVHIYDDPDLDSAHLRVTDSGTVSLLLLGQIKVADLTPGEAAAEIAASYNKRKFLSDAHVQVTIEQQNSLEVAVIGYVNGNAAMTLGTMVLVKTPRPLLTILAMAGGLNVNASRTVVIQRRDPAAPRLTVDLPNDPNKDLDANPLVYPGDTVVVPRAGLVYVLGNVNKPAAVVMNNDDGKLSLLQALTDAGGTMPTTGLRNVRIYRKVNGTYKSQPFNVGKIVNGKAPDVLLEADDVIWVPYSYGKNILVSSASITASLASATATGLIYTR